MKTSIVSTAMFKEWLSGFSLKSVFFPVFGILVFLLLWQVGASKVHTSLGVFPGPVVVYQQWNSLVADHQREKVKEAKFYERQEVRIAKRQAKDPSYVGTIRGYTGKPTFFEQIFTSLYTVLAGFGLASLIAVPVGILIGLNSSIYSALNPIIQIFKPVSPLAWLPLVTMVVSATYVTNDPMFSKSFLTSMFTVTLCCMWPTLVNTAVGVAAVDKDLLNVSKVLQLGWLTHVIKIVIPSAIPLMFTGLRLSLGIAWMVLIAAEMLAQNPGLGKFVWDEFQNGSSNSLGRIMVAVLMIGFIGFLLDRAMLTVQRFVSWDKSQVLR
ncbi:MAG: ABC transporter permease [Marinomonas sp.]|jgi:nitrate/nitrite transport system permease protein|uniref:ABC transporter permease n=2 Tax=Oceanospirillaceae TaxID=135620 RepID=UPI001055B307|nr:ABC transporter permease [Marinomonas sp. KMM3893]